MAQSEVQIQVGMILDAWLRSMHGISLALYRRQHGWRRFFMLDWWRLLFVRFPKGRA